MMGRILNNHIKVHTFKELHIFWNSLETVLILTKNYSSSKTAKSAAKLLLY